MNRKIAIALCLAVVCVALLTAWLYVNRNGQGGAPALKGTMPNELAREKNPAPTQKTAPPPTVFELPVRNAYLGDDEFSPCYLDSENMTLYRWKGVVLRRKQVSGAGPISRSRVLIAKNFTVVPFEAPVKYRESDGEYRPGYVDRAHRVFYEWKGVVLTKQEVPNMSQDGKNAIADPAAFSKVTEIDMPAHLKEHPGLWKKI